MISIALVPSKAAGRSVLRVQGEIDLGSAEGLARELGKLVDSSQVVADLREVTFMDSSGIAALVHFELRMRKLDRTFALLIRDGQVKRLLELTGLIDQFTTAGRLDGLPRK